MYDKYRNNEEFAQLLGYLPEKGLTHLVSLGLGLTVNNMVDRFQGGCKLIRPEDNTVNIEVVLNSLTVREVAFIACMIGNGESSLDKSLLAKLLSRLTLLTLRELGELHGKAVQDVRRLFKEEEA
jgi:hypothetical protein